MRDVRFGLSILFHVRRKNFVKGCRILTDGSYQRNTPNKIELASLRLEVEGVLHCDVIALRQRSEAVHTLHGAHGREVEGGRTTGGLDVSVGRHALAVNIEDD